MTRAVLGLGSNIGDRVEHLRGAVAGLGDEVVARSEVFETAPVGGPDQAAFLNLVVVLDTADEPRRLLERGRALEEAADRVRTERWGPRTLDVDVLWVDGVSLSDPELSVPHPRMYERRFVMAPLAQVAPDLCPPGSVEAAEGPVAVVGDLDELISVTDRRRRTMEGLLATGAPVAVTELRRRVQEATGVAPTAAEVARDVDAVGGELVTGPDEVPLVRAVDGQTAPASDRSDDGEPIGPGRERLVLRVLLGLFVVSALAAAALYLGTSDDSADPVSGGADPGGSIPSDTATSGPAGPPPTVATIGPWDSVRGSWEATSGEYRLTEPSEGPAILAGDPGLDSVSISAAIGEVVPEAGVAFAVTDARNFWALTAAPGAEAGVEAGMGLAVSRVVDGDPTRIGQPAVADAGPGSTLTVEVTASRAGLFLDGEQLLTVTDLGKDPGTGVGLCSLEGRAPAAFGGVVVEAVG